MKIAGFFSIKNIFGKPKIPVRKIGSRNLVWPPEAQKRLVKELKHKLRKGLFISLPIIRGSNYIRKYYFEGIPVAIKDTGFLDVHGHDYNSLKQAFLEYHRAIKAGEIGAKFHSLRSPKVYARVKNFLIMEYVEQTPVQPSEEGSHSQATLEASKNFDHLIKIGRIKGMLVPQVSHIMPQKKEGGKWVFYHPYDSL
ncbi:MAG: hypothetical protein V1494_03455 [Candidatus Diapherotrites archaeon]